MPERQPEREEWQLTENAPEQMDLFEDLEEPPET
jgi:hypothetical protein